LNVTAGPGAINALNGVFGAYVDSMAMIVISGQAKRETMARNYNIPLRQLGDQEVDIVSMVRPITKYATVLQEPEMVRQVMEKAIFLATHGRPGPVWIDVPIDVQGTLIGPDDLPSFRVDIEEILTDDDIHPNTKKGFSLKDDKSLKKEAREVINRLNNAQRPVILAGTGVHISGARNLFLEVIEKLGVPVTTAWTHDLIPYEHPLYCGRPGTIGTRAGNFVVQNADVLLVLGSRLNIRQTSYNWESFASKAFKIQVDVDPTEMEKPHVNIDLKINADLKDFLRILGRALNKRETVNRHDEWLRWCRERVAKYPAVLEKHRNSSRAINPYHFIEILFQELRSDDIVVCGDATACIVPFQVGKIKQGQRLFSNSGCASMGYDLPAAVGAAIAEPSRRIICLAGDGSIQLNIQELQTIRGLDLNIKIFVLNNNGYLSIKQTQENYFGRSVGSGPESNLTFPTIYEIGAAYNIPSFMIKNKPFSDNIRKFLDLNGPAVCEVILDQNQEFEPILRSREMPNGKIVTPRLEDMYPFLDEKELQSNIIE
jgi:acetolactate synthase-1/2/3 large subunit